MQAKLMARHGTTWDRNFDYMNDVDNLARTGKPIVDAGMHHQVCVALMGLPFKDKTVHTADFYIDIIKRYLKTEVQVDSVCMKDASGTCDPKTCYDTAKGLRKILPPEVILWQHTHDTASMAVSCYMAGIEGGVDGIDLSVRPMASGTVQPDVRSMWHALKGTGYSLDIDHSKMDEIEGLLNEGLSEYDFNPVTTSADARVVGFPMPGGAIGPNVHMMKEAGILSKYSDVLSEFPVVVKAGGAWTSVTPGSQQYFLQAFNNVLLGRWKKMNDGYGRAVLGYYGTPPLAPDPEVVKVAADQLEMEPFKGDPLGVAPDSLGPARKEIEKRGLTVNDENVFLVAASIVAGKNMDLNEGIRLLEKRPKIVLPLKKKEQPQAATPAAGAAAPAPPAGGPALLTHPVITSVQVVEGASARTFRVTIEPPGGAGPAPAAAAPAATTPAAAPVGTPVHSPFEGKVQLVDLLVKVGDSVSEGQVVAAVEAMKAKHDVKAPCSGTVKSVDVQIGTDIDASVAIMFIG
jgi:pyruvate carboxylase subunit B